MNKRKLIYTIAAAIILGLSYFINDGPTTASEKGAATPASQQQSQSLADSNQSLLKAYHSHQSKVIVNGIATVEKVLPDDTRGAQHQRFILDVGNGLSVLVAHNIDLAERISNIKVGDRIHYQGEYIYNKKGGILHWTHRDPAGNHEIGWLERNGRRYN